LLRNILLVIGLTAILISIGCSPNKDIPKPEDVKVSAKVSYFNSICEFRSYYGLINNWYMTDEDLKEPMKQTVKVDTSWELAPALRVKEPDRLYYPPYIVIIPPDPKHQVWTYAGGSHANNLISSVGSLPIEVEKLVMVDKTEGWDRHIKIRPKSFEQGFVDISFRKRDDEKRKSFDVYFIYYDPVIKKVGSKT